MMTPAQKIQTTLSVSELPVVLVAGGAGFLGSYLCEELLKLSCQVVCVDNLTIGSKENLGNCLGSPHFSILQKNLNDPDLAKVVGEKYGKVSYIFHLAGWQGVSRSDTTLENLLVNAKGTTNLLEISQKDGAKFLLVSTFNLLGGFLSTSLLEENFGFTSQETKFFSYQEAKRYAEALCTQYYKKSKLDIRIVRIRDVYGPRMEKNSDDMLSQLLWEVAQKNTLHLPGDGLTNLYPVYVDDAVAGILLSMMSTNSSGRIYNLVSPEPVTLLQILREIQNQEQTKIDVVLVKEKNSGPSFSGLIKQTQGFSWKPKKPLGEGLGETISWLRQQNNLETKKDLLAPITNNFKKEEIDQERVVEPVVEESGKANFFWTKVLNRLTPKRKSLLIPVLLILFVVVIFWPFMALTWNVKSGIDDLKSSQKLIASGKINDAVNSINDSRNNFVSAEKNLSKTEWLFNLTGKQKSIAQLSYLLDLAQKGTDSASHLLLAAINYGEAGKIILSHGSGVLAQQLNNGQNELAMADDGFSFLAAQLQEQDLVAPGPSWLKQLLGLKNADETINGLVKKISLAKNYLSQARVLAQIASSIIGLGGKRTYLLLFTNNMELRPAGGFIGSYGLLTMDNGKLSALSIEDVYSADGQLSGHVEPPVPIRKYLNQPHWYLRDSNWSPDFRDSAQQAEWFLEKEVNQKVDGTILIDLNTAKNLLAGLGPIYLSDYGETIDQNNLFAKASLHSQNNFFPGSTQKKDFLGALARRMLDQITQNGSGQSFSLASALFKSINEKHLSLFFHDEASQNVINQFNLGGGLSETPCVTVKNCFGDYLMVVDANLGVNKVNFFVKENFQQKVTMGPDGRITENLQLNYNNTSPNESWPGGTYTDYVRLLLPMGAQLGDIQVDGQPVGFSVGEDSLDRKIPDGSLEVDQEEATTSGKTSLGFLISVPPKTKKNVSLTYNLGQTFSPTDKSAYRLLVQKQLGSQDNDYRLEVDYPDSFVVNSNLAASQQQAGSIIFNQLINTDNIINLEFSKQ